MTKSLLLLSALATLAVACSHFDDGPTATARLEPRSGSTASGTVRFVEREDDAVEVQIDLTGIEPGIHGFHVHENGDCSAADASSAGGHFNPTNAPHGGPRDSSRHVGDFGNLTAGPNGEIHEQLTLRGVRVRAGTTSIVGRALVLHAKRDDLTTQPSGDAGARIACGVITAEGQR